jgi:hypothetical protein
MQSYNAKRNFITNAKQKWKNASKIVSQCLKQHHAQNCSNDTVAGKISTFFSQMVDRNKIKKICEICRGHKILPKFWEFF